MKRIVLVTALIFAVSVVSFARKFVAEGKTHTAFGNYTIEIADDLFSVNGKELKAFVVTYENTNMEVTVAFDKTRRGMKYYVLSDMLSVQYVCNQNYFGVEKLDKDFEREGYRTSESILNRSEYFHQKIITTGGKCDLDNSKLIAAYYPMLINNPENLIAAK